MRPIKNAGKCAGIEWDEGGTETQMLQQMRAYLEGRHGALSDDQRAEVCREFWHLQACIGECVPSVPAAGVHSVLFLLARNAVIDAGQEFVDIWAPLVDTTPVFSKFGDCLELAPGWSADFPQPTGGRS